MIDWYDIEYLYPESFNRFIGIMFPNVGVVSTSILKHFDVKKLYYFFDKEGVYLTVEKCCPHIWVYGISTDKGTAFGNGSSNGSTREEIEMDGFIECFRVLEKKLKHENEKYL